MPSDAMLVRLMTRLRFATAVTALLVAGVLAWLAGK